MTANVHILHPKPRLSEELWTRAPSLMRSRSSRTEVEKAVRAIRGDIDAGELVSAFERYLAEDPDYRRYRLGTNGAGPPGLHRWLNWRRWESWLTPALPNATDSPLEQPDNPIRAALIQALGADWVRSYIDPFELIDGVLIVPEGKLTARARLLEKRDVLRAAGVRAMRKP